MKLQEFWEHDFKPDFYALPMWKRAVVAVLFWGTLDVVVLGVYAFAVGL